MLSHRNLNVNNKSYEGKIVYILQLSLNSKTGMKIIRICLWASVSTLTCSIYFV